jgi:hypothetical protein
MPLKLIAKVLGRVVVDGLQGRWLWKSGVTESNPLLPQEIVFINIGCEGRKTFYAAIFFAAKRIDGVSPLSFSPIMP